MMILNPFCNNKPIIFSFEKIVVIIVNEVVDGAVMSQSLNRRAYFLGIVARCSLGAHGSALKETLVGLMDILN